MSVILRAENLSKVYQLGQTGTGTLKKDLYRWWAVKFQKKEDPFAIEQIPSKAQGDTLWALKNVSFEVNQGEILGIVGSNGSGKSTLLKILSRIVRPTSGTIMGKGKVNSLLEIGTGFNADLTGRENIFLNGYFLGMKKQEVQQRFDEIVAFSGVERFIDTPVKRYSSGMYMRLAFSVAAHLEPDILIVDEVLAVGDAEFQSKCIHKMQEASRMSGRTILFVSHDTHTVANLCSKSIWLDKGKVMDYGDTIPVMNSYLASYDQGEELNTWENPDTAPGAELIKLKKVRVFPYGAQPSSIITVETPIQIMAEFFNFIDEGNLEICIKIFTNDGLCLFDIGSPTIKAEKKILALEMVVPGNLLNDRTYFISIRVLHNGFNAIHEFKDCASIDVKDFRLGSHYLGSWSGVIRPNIEIKFNSKESSEKI